MSYSLPNIFMNNTHTRAPYMLFLTLSCYIICIEEKSEFEDMPKITELCKWHILSSDTGLLKAK